MKVLLALFFAGVANILICAGDARAQTLAAGACTLKPQSQTCLDTTPCKTDSNGNIACLQGSTLPSGAIQLTQTCWKYGYTYACQGEADNTCTQYSNNSACSLSNTTCTGYLGGSGNCNSWTNTYSCITQAAQTSQHLVCASNLVTPINISANSKPNNNFVTAALALEISNETQIYSTSPNNIFYGVSESCTIGDFGIKNCCRAAPGAKSNAAIFTLIFGAAASTVRYVGQAAVDAASPYAFDAMYQSGVFTQGMYESFIASSNVIADEGGNLIATQFASGGVSLGAYGFTFSTTEVAAESGIFGSSTTLAGGANGYIAFDPYVFAGYVALQIIQNLASCSQNEQLLALHRGANLSAYEGQNCSNRIPIIGTCIEWTNSYCSFNSVLAMIINQQGKAQLGLDPSNCQGLTQAQLSQIDMSKIDFSQFTTTMRQQALQNMPSKMGQNYAPALSTSSGGSNQKSNNAVLPKRN